MPAHIPHAVYARTDFKMMSIRIHPPADRFSCLPSCRRWLEDEILKISANLMALFPHSTGKYGPEKSHHHILKATSQKYTQ